MSSGAGRALGKYYLIAEIAQGGMGIVYLALVQGPGGFNKLVVVKELKPELVEEPAFLTMFMDEARLAARLNHSNIVQTNEVGNDGDRHFMAMDYLDGRGLDRLRRRSKKSNGLSLPMHLRVLCDVLAGLEYAHTLTDFDGTPLHIVHRDVSPQNVFVTFDGQVKLLDFGIAKARDSMHETHAGVLKGKVAYMAPEQARGFKVDARADVFSVGVLLWEALAGRRMHDGQSNQARLWALASGNLPRPSSVKPWIPPELDDICARAIACERDERYASAGALRDDLEDYLTRTGTNVTSRDVGRCVTELFGEDRAATNALIESHIARARAGATSGAVGASHADVPVIDVATSHTPSNERSPYSLVPSPSTHLPVPPSPSSPSSLAALAGPPVATQRIASLEERPPVKPTVERTAERPPEPVIERSATPPAKSRALRVAIPATVALGIAVSVVVARSGDQPAASTRRDDVRSSTATAAPPAPAPAPAPAAAHPPRRLIDVAISATPANATITIDGAELTGNPVRATYEASPAMHTIRITAPGYLPRSKAIAFERDVALELVLEKAPPPPRPVAAAPPRPPPRPARPAVAPATPEPQPETKPPPPPSSIKPATPTEISPAGGTKPRRPIDPTNPYGGSE